MADESNEIVVEHLRHIRAKVDSLDDHMGRVELRLSAVEGHLASLLIGEVGQNSEIDKIKHRLDRIEHRLELADG
jgi:hypothetical protein